MGSAEDAPVLNLKMFMGAKNVTGGVLNQVKVMTDFEDVQNIYNDLSESGASDLRLSLPVSYTHLADDTQKKSECGRNNEHYAQPS